MKLLLLSDSHGASDQINRALQTVKREGIPDALLYAGDGMTDLIGLDVRIPMFLVRGNCDMVNPFDAPYEHTLVFSKTTIFLSHGHLQRVKQTLDLLAEKAKNAGALAAIYGHTHHQQTDYIKGVLLINPGSIRNGKYALLYLRDGENPRAELRQLP